MDYSSIQKFLLKVIWCKDKEQSSGSFKRLGYYNDMVKKCFRQRNYFVSLLPKESHDFSNLQKSFCIPIY